MPFARGPVLTYVGRGQYLSVGPTEYVGERDVIHIPDGTRTDLASVPRIFWALMPPTGVYEQAAFVHDHGCQQLAAGTCALSSRDVDGLFRRIAREAGADPIARWLLWCGVRWGALANPARRPGWAADAPAVLAITATTAATAVAVLWVADRIAHAALRRARSQ